MKAQDLLNIYKTGTIRIKPYLEFGVNNRFFESGNKTLKRYTNIVISENEDIYLLDRKDYQILKFDKSGSLIKKIGLNLKKSDVVYFHVSELDILDNKYFLIRGYAFIKVYDLNGNFVKSIDFDYPIYSFTALKNNKVAIKGYVQLKDLKTKMHIAVVDIQTEKETPVIDFIKDRKKEHISIKPDRRGSFAFGSSQRAPKIFITSTQKGNLIVGNSKNPGILIYNIQGEQINKINLTYSTIEVGQKEKDKIYQNYKKIIKKYNGPDSLLEVIKSPDFYFQTMPYYYGIKVDSENNILVFKYTKDKNHTFRVYQVYSKEGKFICETTIESGEFENPSLRLSAFSKGKLYALLKLKEEKSKLRLVKAELTTAL